MLGPETEHFISIFFIFSEEVRQPPKDSDNNLITPKSEEETLETEETPVQPMDPVSDDEDDSDLESNHEHENTAKAVTTGDDTVAASDDHETNPTDKNPSPQGAEALPPSSLDTAPPDEIAEEAKEDEKESLGDKKSEPTPIPSNLNLVSGF